MKAKVKETNQIVDVVCQGICVGCDKRTVVWTDGEHRYYQEQLDFTKDIDWEQRRYEIAKSSINTAWKVCVKYDYSSSKYSHISDDDIAKESVDIADSIIKQLKRK